MLSPSTDRNHRPIWQRRWSWCVYSLIALDSKTHPSILTSFFFLLCRQELVPEESDYHVPFSTTLYIVLGSVEFKNNVVDRLKRELDVTLITPRLSVSRQPDQQGDCRFVLRFNRSNVEILPTAKATLED